MNVYTIKDITQKQLKMINKNIKKLFGLKNLTEVISEIKNIEHWFNICFHILKDDIYFDKVQALNSSEALENWARLETLKYLLEMGEKILIFKNIDLPRIEITNNKFIGIDLGI
jgi:hypothetical protein